MEAVAKLKHLKGSPRKARLVIDLIRGENVSRALSILKFTDKRAADPIAKCLNSAIANATFSAEQQNIAIDPDDLWVKMIGESMLLTTGRAPNIVPNSSGGNPSRMFLDILGIPVIWVPHSYAACQQHAPNEHALVPLIREGLALMAGIWWDIGNGKSPLRAS